MLSDGQIACFGYDGNACRAVRYDPADGSLHELMQTTEDEYLCRACAGGGRSG